MNNHLIKTLEDMKELFGRVEKEGFKYSSSQELVLSLGKEYKPNEKSLNYGKMANKECFRNATMVSSENKELTYVEGYAYSKGFEGWPIHHAWCVDEVGNVVEVTWKEAGTEYFGIAFENEYLWEILLTTEVFGLITGMPNDKYNPYKNGFPEGGLK